MSESKRIRFLAGLQEILEHDKLPKTDDRLHDIGSWDSLAHLCTMVLIDEIGGKVSAGRISKCEIVGELLSLLGEDCNG